MEPHSFCGRSILILFIISLVKVIIVQDFGIGKGCGMKNEIATVLHTSSDELEPCSLLRKFGAKDPTVCSINPTIVFESSGHLSAGYFANNTLVDGGNDVRGPNPNFWIASGLGSGFVIDLGCQFKLSAINLRNAHNGLCNV